MGVLGHPVGAVSFQDGTRISPELARTPACCATLIPANLIGRTGQPDRASSSRHAARLATES